MRSYPFDHAHLLLELPQIISARVTRNVTFRVFLSLYKLLNSAIQFASNRLRQNYSVFNTPLLRCLIVKYLAGLRPDSPLFQQGAFERLDRKRLWNDNTLNPTVNPLFQFFKKFSLRANLKNGHSKQSILFTRQKKTILSVFRRRYDK